MDHVTIPDAFYALTQEGNLPLTTRHERAVGMLKLVPEDFIVEEIPAYTPSGNGDFLYLWVEKTGIDTVTLLKRMSESLSIQEKEIGYAGIKDKQAVTRQWMSVPSRCKESLVQLDNEPAVQLLEVTRHEHRIRTGKLAGNRFDIHIRSQDFDWAKIQDTATSLTEIGTGNFYGSQRFGHRGKSASLGWALLLKEQSKRTKKAGRSRFMRKFALSAAQGLIFNRITEQRMLRDELRTVLPHDILQKRESGGLFLSEDREQEQARLEQKEIVPTAPMVGRKDRWKEAPGRQWEADAIAESGIPLAAYEAWGKLALGTRRPMLVYPENLTVTQTAEGFRVQFSLQSGAYATMIMREFFQPCPE